MLPLAGHFGKLERLPVPILNGFSQHVVQRPADWGAHIHMTGYWFPEDQGWQPPADLLRFIEAGDPPVFIGFGSMPLKDPRRTTEITLAALEQSGRRGILHTGWGGLGEQALPGSVFKLDYAPYSWLFARMAMLIHHGGSGTTAFALRSGVPSCAVSFVFDQHYWGERIARLGAGPEPIRHTALSVKRLYEAIQLGVNDSQMRQKVIELGGKIRAENGIENAKDTIEQMFHTQPAE